MLQMVPFYHKRSSLKWRGNQILLFYNASTIKVITDSHDVTISPLIIGSSIYNFKGLNAHQR